MELLKDAILNKIQVAGEVNGALDEHNLVVVTKGPGENPVYRIYGAELPEGPFIFQATMKDGQLDDMVPEWHR